MASSEGGEGLKDKPHSAANHALAVLKSLYKLRQSNLFCDVELHVEKQVFPGHRNVLVAASPYFSAMLCGSLSEGNKSAITIFGIPADVFSKLIDYMYTGDISINADDCQDLLSGADMLGLSEVMEACCDFMRDSLHPSNAIGIYLYAEAHCCIGLQEAAETFIHSHFREVSEGSEFLDIPKTALVQLLHSENLNVENELQVLSAAMKWILEDAGKRRRMVFEILSQVRLAVISLRELDAYIQSFPDLSLKIALAKVAQDFHAERRGLTEIRLSRLKPYLLQPRKCACRNIFVIGGYSRSWGGRWSDSQSLSRVEYFSSFNQAWKPVAPLKYARSGLGVAVLNGLIYAVGGESESLIFDYAESYDPTTNRWTVIESLIVPRCGLSLCAVNGFLYTIGGWVGSEIGETIEKYNPKTGLWTVDGKMNTPRFAMGVIEHQGLVYVIGGFNELGSELATAESYNPVTKEWQRLGNLKFPRAYVGLAVLNGCIYAVGGWNEMKGALQSVEKYSIEEDSWSRIPSMSTPRAGACIAAAKGILYVIGGRSLSDQYTAPLTLDTVECYDPDEETWFDLDVAPTGRCEAGTVVL